MDQALTQRLQIPLQTLSTPILVLGVSGEPIPGGRIMHRTGPVSLRLCVLHVERLNFLLLPYTKDPVILGLLWLREYDLQSIWSSGELVPWSPRCFSHYLTLPCCASLVERPGPKDRTGILSSLKSIRNTSMSSANLYLVNCPRIRNVFAQLASWKEEPFLWVDCIPNLLPRRRQWRSTLERA